MPNIAVLGPLEVIGAPVKALLYVDFKNRRAKIHVLIFISKKGRVQAQKCHFIEKFHSFIQIQTHSSGIHAISMAFWARLVPKIALFEKFWTKNHFSRQISPSKFRNDSPIFPFCLILHKKLLQSFEGQYGGLSKNGTSKVGNDGHFLKIITYVQKPYEKCPYVKNGHI